MRIFPRIKSIYCVFGEFHGNHSLTIYSTYYNKWNNRTAAEKPRKFGFAEQADRQRKTERGYSAGAGTGSGAAGAAAESAGCFFEDFFFFGWESAGAAGVSGWADAGLSAASAVSSAAGAEVSAGWTGATDSPAEAAGAGSGAGAAGGGAFRARSAWFRNSRPDSACGSQGLSGFAAMKSSYKKRASGNCPSCSWQRAAPITACGRNGLSGLAPANAS